MQPYHTTESIAMSRVCRGPSLRVWCVDEDTYRWQPPSRRVCRSVRRETSTTIGLGSSLQNSWC